MPERKIEDLGGYPTDAIPVPANRPNVYFGVDDLNDSTSYRVPLQNLLDWVNKGDIAATATFTSGLPVAVEGAMVPRALRYDGVSFSFATANDDPFDVWGFVVAVVNATTVRVRTLAEMQGRVYTDSVPSPPAGDVLYLQGDGTAGSQQTQYRLWQRLWGSPNTFVVHSDLLAIGSSVQAISEANYDAAGAPADPTLLDLNANTALVWNVTGQFPVNVRLGVSTGLSVGRPQFIHVVAGQTNSIVFDVGAGKFVPMGLPPDQSKPFTLEIYKTSQGVIICGANSETWPT